MQIFRRSNVLLPSLILLFCVHTAHGTEVQLARAIGDAYLPQPEPRSMGSASDSPVNRQPAADLPTLGASASSRSTTGVWTKILIGAGVVAAIALIGKGGDSASINSDGSTSSGGNAPVGGSGSGSGGIVNSGGSSGISPPPKLNDWRERRRGRDKDKDD